MSTIAIFALAALSVVAAGCGASELEPTATSAAAPPSENHSHGPGWHKLSTAPVGGRADHSVVWTDREMIVWGGSGDRADLADGAAYDPATNRWRQIAPAPLAPRARHVAVWTGEEMVVWGGEAGGGQYPFADGAAYHPDTDSWRMLPSSPLEAGRFAHTGVWTGDEVVVYGGFTNVSVEGSIGSESGEAAAYDPATNRWRALSAWRARHDHGAVWTGAEMIVWGGDGPDVFEDDGALYDPGADSWRTLPRSPLEGRVLFSVVWTGEEMILFGGASNLRLSLEGAAYSATRNAWRRLPPAPVGFRWGHEAAWTGREMVVWGGSDEPEIPPRYDSVAAAAYDPAADAWRPLPRPPLAGREGHTAVWTGSELIVWGGEACEDGCRLNDGAAYVSP